MYGFAKAAAIGFEGYKDSDRPAPRRKRDRHETTAGGVVLPTGVDAPTPEEKAVEDAAARLDALFSDPGAAAVERPS